MNLSQSDITFFILSIAIMLFFARLFGELFRKIKQPVVIGEIVAGVILGPTVIGYFFPDLFNTIFNSSQLVKITIDGFVEIAIIMLMLVTGLEVDLSIVFSQSKKATIISIFSIVFPFAFGFLTAYNFPNIFGIGEGENKLLFALFIGTALSVTALPVVVRMLMDLNIFKTENGIIIITAAMFTDIFGWIFFSFILSLLNPISNSNYIFNQIIIIILFISFIILIGRKIFNSIIKFLEKFTISKGGVISFIFIIGFFGAAFTQYIGVHAILGAFVIGIALGDSFHINDEIREIVQQFATNIFAPIFFVSIGLKLNFIENFSLLTFLILVIISILGKILGSYVGSFLSGINKNDSFIIGFGMNSYGAMQVVLSLVAKQVGLINDKVFVSLILLAITSSIISAPIMSIFIKRGINKLLFVEYLKKDLIYFTNKKDKYDVINEMCKMIAKYYNLDENYIFTNVLTRENQMSTGLTNNIAIPHAKIEIEKPILALAMSNEGIDFDSLDGRKTNFIFMLLTPENNPEIQLKLLREIAKQFSDGNFSEKLKSTNDINRIYNLLKLN